MLRFSKTKVAKEEVYAEKKNIWIVSVDNIIISNVVETKNNSNYLVWYLD